MKRLGIAVLIAAVLIAVTVTSCGPKDALSLSGLDKRDLYVGDRYQNKVRVENATEILRLIKEAKSVPVSTSIQESEIPYVLEAGTSRSLYDPVNKYLLVTDSSGKKHAFAVDLNTALAQIKGLPPVYVKTSLSEALNQVVDAVSKIKEPAALMVSESEKNYLVVLAGERPSGGYTLGVEEVSFKDGKASVSVRLTPPKEAAATVLTYPYLALECRGNAEVEVFLVDGSKTPAAKTRVPLSKVGQGQNVIALRPERGALITESLRIVGFAKLQVNTMTVEVEDGHNVLGIKTLSVETGKWSFFDVNMNLSQATNPYGMVMFVTRSKDGARVEELMVPVSFGGK